jgi:hypothetical protein
MVRRFGFTLNRHGQRWLSAYPCHNSGEHYKQLARRESIGVRFRRAFVVRGAAVAEPVPSMACSFTEYAARVVTASVRLTRSDEHQRVDRHVPPRKSSVLLPRFFPAKESFAVTEPRERKKAEHRWTSDFCAEFPEPCIGKVPGCRKRGNVTPQSPRSRATRSGRLTGFLPAPLRELAGESGASAGSRTRINGFGGHYTIHCATLAKVVRKVSVRAAVASSPRARETRYFTAGLRVNRWTKK